MKIIIIIFSTTLLVNKDVQLLNPDLRGLAATQAKRTAASDLRHCATGAG